MRESRDGRNGDDSASQWWRRPAPNWWLRFAIPALILFGGGFLFRVLLRGVDEVAIVYGVSAALAVVALLIGISKALRRDAE